MKKLLAFFAAALVAATSSAADQAPLFNAALTMGKEQRFLLVSQPEGKSSGFLALGETFAGYTVKAFDAKTSTLDLERDGQITKVTLVGNAAIGNAPALAIPATVADAEAMLNKIHFEDLLERAMQGQKKMLAAQFQRMSQQMAAQGADPTDVAAFQKKLTDEVFGAMDPKTLKGDVSRIYSEVFTKDDLSQISAFYDTPLGQTMLSKQPEVQEKLGTIIQGRMMDVMPKVQQMSRDFAVQQKAKRDAAKAAGGGAPAAPAPASNP